MLCMKMFCLTIYVSLTASFHVIPTVFLGFQIIVVVHKFCMMATSCIVFMLRTNAFRSNVSRLIFIIGMFFMCHL